LSRRLAAARKTSTGFQVTIALALLLAVAGCAADDPITSGSQGSARGLDAVLADPPPEDSATPLFGDLEKAEIDVELLVTLDGWPGDGPIGAVTAPNGEWWVAEWGGTVIAIDPQSGAIGDVVIDITDETEADQEQGLLGIAVDDTALYLNFTDLAGNTQLDAWLLDDSGRPGKRHRLLSIDQPYPSHNGGGLAIGPDGLLYIGMGDGGWQAPENGQDPQTLLGSILRIRPTPGADAPYEIPADNPYADGGGAPEIFLIGVRNPWRFSFDPATDNLWVADVGLVTAEEVTLLAGADGWGRGANLGWDLLEGTLRHSGDRPLGNVDPVFEYYHDGDPDSGDPSGCAITGGHVYRGSAIPELLGSYVFGDYCTSRVWALSIADGKLRFRDLASVPGKALTGFALDPSHELVALTLHGTIYRIVPH